MKPDKVTIVDTEIYTLWIYPAERLPLHARHRYAGGDDLRHCLTAAVEGFEQYRCVKWLSDD